MAHCEPGGFGGTPVNVGHTHAEPEGASTSRAPSAHCAPWRSVGTPVDVESSIGVLRGSSSGYPSTSRTSSACRQGVRQDVCRRRQLRWRIASQEGASGRPSTSKAPLANCGPGGPSGRPSTPRAALAHCERGDWAGRPSTSKAPLANCGPGGPSGCPSTSRPRARCLGVRRDVRRRRDPRWRVAWGPVGMSVDVEYYFKFKIKIKKPL